MEGYGTNPLYFKQADNVWYYVPVTEKEMYSLILRLYSSGKVADIHCYDQSETKMGVLKWLTESTASLRNKNDEAEL